MVTAMTNPREKVEGLDAGADDYVTKPFSPRELVARVRAVLRRASLWEKRSEPLSRFGDLEIDFARHRVTLGAQAVNLTATEYALLSYLARNAGRVLTPDQILEKVWGEDYVGESHLLQVNVTRLRQKIKDDAREPRYIFTRPGIGYAMAEEA
jgi:DNA-binding response OmpR family regulator